MGGGLMQLVAYGAQDIYLTGQPQITFFKSVYRRHTNFAVESIQQTINGSVVPGARVSVTVSRNGDLLKNLWIEYNPSTVIVTTSDCWLGCDFSHALLQQLELEIGGQLIDRQYGLWLTVWRELTECNPTGIQAPLGLGIGGQEPSSENDVVYLPTRYQQMSYTHKGNKSYNNFGTGGYGTASAPQRAYIPMAFWFCKNPGLAIPLIALQYHEVKFNIQFALANQFVLPDTTAPTVDLTSITVYADYIYLDTTERRQFAQNAHEYLIDQLQYQQESGVTTSSETIRLNFNHPVKELIWCGTPLPVTVITPSQYSVITGGATPFPITGSIPAGSNFPPPPTTSSKSGLTTKIVLNGTDRFSERHFTYFTRNQIWDTHTGFGSTANPDCIAVYSFALRPEEHQPSGTCNFSRIDTAQLVFNNANSINYNGTVINPNPSNLINPLTIFAVNYNVLRIMSGMGGLAYSN